MLKQIKKAKRISKKNLDSLISEIINLKNEKNKIETVLKDKIDQIEGMYRKEANIPESLLGIEYEANKVIIDKGKNLFNPTIIESYIKNLNIDVEGIIELKKEVNADKVYELVKLGKINNEMVDAARFHRYTYSTQFNKKKQNNIEQVNESITVLK